jgi:nitronate monooxygenase
VTDLLKKLGIEVPIVLAPMAGAVGPELCAAVSKAGGLGLIPLWHGPDIGEAVASVRRLTNGPFGVNLNDQFAAARDLETAITAGVGIVSLFWGVDTKLIERARSAGLTVIQTVGKAAEAKTAVSAGADLIVAQGWEAGGHV